MADVVTALLEVLALALIVAGVAMLSTPAGWIAAGVALLAVARGLAE